MKMFPRLVIGSFLAATLGACAAHNATCEDHATVTVTVPPLPASAAPPTEAAGEVDAAVAKVLDDWHDAAAHADEQRYFDHFAEGAVFLGTDGKERWTLPQFRAYAHPHFAKGKAWTMRATRREITFHSGVAWFDEDLVSNGLGAVRGSGILVRANGTWKIAQYNLSVPVPNEKFPAVKQLIEGQAPPAPTKKPDYGY